MCQALTSTQNSYEERTLCYRTKPDQLYPRAFSLRPNRVLFVFAVFKGLKGEKMLALRLRTSATWSASPLMLFSSLRSNHLKRTIIQRTEQKDTHRQKTRSISNEPPMAQRSLQTREGRVTAAFQSGAFSPFPPGSNCLFSSLFFFSSLGLWPCCRKVMSAVILVLLIPARVSTLSVVGESPRSRDTGVRNRTSLLHEPFECGEFLVAHFTLFNCIDKIADLLSRHRNCIFQRVHRVFLRS